MSDSLKRTAILVVAFLPVLVLGYIAFHRNDAPLSSPIIANSSSPSELKTMTPVPVSIMQAPVSSGMMTASIYTDGTFTAMGSYRSPEGTDALTVFLTVKDDVVTAVSLVEQPTSRQSQMWQDRFASGYKVFVVGKNLADLQLTNVSGASLTSRGFNDALDKIRFQAKVI